MTADIFKLEVLQGDGFTIAADDVLEAAKGKLTKCFVVDVDEAGDLFLAGSDGVAESVFLMERAKALFVSSDVGRFE